MKRDEELAKCWHPDYGVFYFVENYVSIENPQVQAWMPFHLWQAQWEVLEALVLYQLVICLKARQLGLTWLCLAYAMWLMLFRPGSSIAIWSLREDESIYLLDNRIKGMLAQLPEWMVCDFSTDNKKVLQLDNGSVARAFPTNKGDSYTNTYGLVDEAALLDLDSLLGRIKPTIDNGGKLTAISRANKKDPGGAFANTFRGAQRGENNWKWIFLPWDVHPDRDQDWFNEIEQEIITRTGSDDERKEQYPATAEEALEANTLDKRFSPDWVDQCYEESKPLPQQAWVDIAPAGVPLNLKVYELPKPGHEYIVGDDAAEGNPTSDYSAFTVIDNITGRQVAAYSARTEPDTFADYIYYTARWYNRAASMDERNNHGHTIISILKRKMKVLRGHDGKPGWLQSAYGKSLMYRIGAEQLRDRNVTIVDPITYSQIKSIVGSTLSAPPGLHDDDATCFLLALAGRVYQNGSDMNVGEAPQEIVDYRG